MSHLKKHPRSAIEKYLRYGNGQGQGYIVINDTPEQKGESEEMSKECNDAWNVFLRAKESHDEATDIVFSLQDDLNQINITIENILRGIKDSRTGHLLRMAADMIPLLRAARLARGTRNIIAAVGDILGDLLVISDLYAPIKKQKDFIVRIHKELKYWNTEMDRLEKEKERLFHRYNRMDCPAK